jgi:hypothetical protein
VRAPVNIPHMTLPTADDLRAKVFRDREHDGDWRVEKMDDDGETIAVTIFSGDNPMERARAYAVWRYGSFEEVELQPYG